MILLLKSKNDLHGLTMRLTAFGAIALAMLFLLAPLYGFPTGPLTYILFVTGTVEFLLAVQDRKSTLFNLRPHSTLTRTLVYVLVFFATIEISSATYYALRPFNLAGSLPLGQLDAQVELQLAYAPFKILPWLYVGFLTSWFWVPVVNVFWKSNTKRIPPDEPKLDLTSPPSALYSFLVDPRFFLAIALATFIGYYPYFQNSPWLVGTDSYFRYYDPLLDMNSKGGLAAFRLALREWHPVPLMFLYVVHLLTGIDLFQVVKLSPLFLTIALGFAFWWFMARKGPSSRGLLAFTFSTLSATTALAMYSSSVANWAVLVLWVVFSGYFVLSAARHFRVSDFFVLLFVSTLMLIIHPWTWGVFAAFMVVTSAVAIVQERRNALRVSVSPILIVVIDVAFGLFSIRYLAGSQGWRVVDALSYYTYVFKNPNTIFEFWPALDWTTRIWSPFFSPIYIFLAIIGVFVLLRKEVSTWQRRLILSWIFVSMIGSILVAPIGYVPNSPASSDSQLWRLVFLTPFQVTAPLAVIWLSNRNKLTVETGDVRGGHTWLPGAWLLTVLSFGILVAFAPYTLGLALLLLLIPIITSYYIERSSGREAELLGYIIQAICVLIAFNYVCRALSQLLINPHSYVPTDAQSGSV